MSVAAGPKIDTENLVFCLDFGNTGYDSKEFINDLPFTQSKGTITTTTYTGNYNITASGQLLFDNQSVLGSYTWSNGWSVIVITEWSNYASKANGYYGIIGTGNGYTNTATDRLLNMYWYKSASGLQIHHSAARADQTNYTGSNSSYFQSVFTNDQPIMTAYTNAITTQSYYIHGNFTNSASVGAARTTYPSANDLSIGRVYPSTGSDYDGKIYTVLVYSKPLTAIEHKRIYDTMKPRFNLQSGTL